MTQNGIAISFAPSRETVSSRLNRSQHLASTRWQIDMHGLILLVRIGHLRMNALHAAKALIVRIEDDAVSTCLWDLDWHFGLRLPYMEIEQKDQSATPKHNQFAVLVNPQNLEIGFTEDAKAVI